MLVICVGLAMPMDLAAQAPPADPIRELLAEVHALRLAMEKASTVGARIQLLVARIQLQEQRITELSKRLVAIRDQLAGVETGIAANASEVARLERQATSTNADVRANAEGQLERIKGPLAALEKRRQDLANEEAQLMQQVSADQSRWSDVNNQLDDLERSLTPPKP
jgi:chromosome segregation ATPase